MKTLKELNSKWYWRLTKVIYFFVAGIVLIASIFGYYEEFKTYNPNDLSKITKDIEEASSAIADIKKEAELLNGDYSSGNLWKTASGGNISTGLIYYILSKEEFSNIEGIYIVCAYSPKENCEIPGIDRTSYGKYKKTGKELSVPKYEIDEFNDTFNKIESLQLALDKSKKDESNYFGYDLIKNYNENYGANISTYRDYHGFIEYIKIVLSFIATVAGVVLFTFIIKSTIYYIILGMAFPKE